MYQLYRLFGSEWLVWEKPVAFPSRRQAIRFFRHRYSYRNGTFKVRKVK